MMLTCTLALMLLPVCLGGGFDHTDRYSRDIAQCMANGDTPCRFDPNNPRYDFTCIKKMKLCDGHVDCPGGSDESSCWESTLRDKLSPCNNFEVQCPGDNHCAEVCNGITECRFGEDEMACTICADDEISCKKHNGWRGCAKLCDGVPECYNNLDESNCVSKKCTEDEIICRDGNCATLCNNCTDCRKGEDEHDCYNEDVVVDNNICPFGHICCADGVNYDTCDVLNSLAAIWHVEDIILRSQCLHWIRTKCQLLNFLTYAGTYA